MKTENRKFYDVMKALCRAHPAIKAGNLDCVIFSYPFRKMGMPPDSFLAGYDESVDYRCVVLSGYYHEIWWNEELDFRGNPQGNLDYAWEMADAMKKHGIPEEYIGSHYPCISWEEYKHLVQKYNLVSW